jgi:pimeloyl-ACP methyl ester carboxylesterase
MPLDDVQALFWGVVLMKFRSILTKALLATALAISQNLFFISGSNQAKAQEGLRPYVVLVNGQGNCYAWGMDALVRRLGGSYEFRSVPYSNFRDGGQSGGGNAGDWSSVDTQFLRSGADFINNQLDMNRPLIIIDHSYGGDSVLKLLPRINRRVQFVAVIDPVGTGGFRRIAQESSALGNVDYFFNRWQENVMFPVDFSRNGSIRCNAKQCDQDSQNIARGEDGSSRTIECRWDEVTCPGFVAPNSLIGRPERKGRKQVRTGHQDLPKDAYIQKILSDKIQQQMRVFVVSNSSPYVFNADYYLATYGDLRNAFGTDRVRAETHWQSNGIREGSQGSPDFSPKCYLNRYPDLQNAFGPANYSRALIYYLNNGMNERRNGRC